MAAGTPRQWGHCGNGDTAAAPGQQQKWILCCHRDGSLLGFAGGTSPSPQRLQEAREHPAPGAGELAEGTGKAATEGHWHSSAGSGSTGTASPASHEGRAWGAEHGLEQLPQKRWQRPSPSRDPKGDLTAPSRVFPTHEGSAQGRGSLGPAAALPSILPLENAPGSFGKGRRNSSTPSQTSPGGPKVWGDSSHLLQGQPGLASLPPEPEGIQGAQEVTTASL